jgi:hypothetical protein
MMITKELVNLVLVDVIEIQMPTINDTRLGMEELIEND